MPPPASFRPPPQTTCSSSVALQSHVPRVQGGMTVALAGCHSSRQRRNRSHGAVSFVNLVCRGWLIVAVLLVAAKLGTESPLFGEAMTWPEHPKPPHVRWPW